MRPCLCETGRTARRCHEASVIRLMSGNRSVRKKVDLIWSVVSSSGDSALECDRERVQGWFRALCLSKTSRTPPRSGLSDKRKGSTRHLGVRRDQLGWFTSTQPPGARRRVGGFWRSPCGTLNQSLDYAAAGLPSGWTTSQVPPNSWTLWHSTWCFPSWA
jgi:hypothetical protein